MSTLIFHALTAYVHDGYGRESTEISSVLSGKDPVPGMPDRTMSITMKLTPDGDTRVKLATGETFGEMEGNLRLLPSDELHPVASADKTKNQIGDLRYLPAFKSDDFAKDAHYQLSTLIPRGLFDQLLVELREGRMPMSMFVEIDGLTHPDEYSSAWDNKAHKFLPMVSIRFSMRVAHFPPIDWEDEKEVAMLMPVTRADLKATVQGIEGLVSRVNARLNWLIAGMAVVVVAILLKG